MRLVGGVYLAALALLALAVVSLLPMAAVVASPAATGTSYPLYLPHLSRRLGVPTPTPDLPPPVTPEPITGYVCRRPEGTGICWTSAMFVLARGPGAACGPDMSPVYFLTSDTVNFEVYETDFVRVRGSTDEFPTCPPLLHVVDLAILPAP